MPPTFHVFTITVTGSDSASSNATFGLVVGVRSRFSSWLERNGIPGEPAGADFDNDGLCNFLEYALGGNPRSSGGAVDHLSGETVSFTKGSDAMGNADIDYSIEESDDLRSWSPVVVHRAPNAAPVISWILPSRDGPRFARLRVTLTP